MIITQHIADNDRQARSLSRQTRRGVRLAFARTSPAHRLRRSQAEELGGGGAGNDSMGSFAALPREGERSRRGGGGNSKAKDRKM
eukprot:687332-Hanusia_phi.AAC.1